MSLRDQPYLPLYIQDYLTDEKLNMCSWKTQGIYIKILCVLHKQSNYGTILFKQTVKQEDKQGASEMLTKCSAFAEILVKNIPCQVSDMIEALLELSDNEVLIISDDKLLQKRMIRDFETSKKRSEAAKKGGGNPILFKQKDKQVVKQKDKQNPEYEYDNEIENKIVFNSSLEKSEKPLLIPTMCDFWYSKFPDYVRAVGNDSEGMGKMIKFMQEQDAALHDTQDEKTQEEILKQLGKVAAEVSKEKFWINKPIKTISKHVQEFYIKMKNPVNGKPKQVSKGFIEVPEDLDYENENIGKW